jgi:hypothetical protein
MPLTDLGDGSRCIGADDDVVLHGFFILFQVKEHAMRISTTDPISGADIKNPEGCPFVLEGKGEGALKIYFENEDNKKAYLEIQTEHPGEDFTTNLDNPARMGTER